MKRILTTLFVLASTSVSGIAAAAHYEGRYDSRYDNRYYDTRYDDYYYDDRSNDDWYEDSRYDNWHTDNDYYDSRYDDDWYGDRYRSSSYRYSSHKASKLHPIARTKTIEIRSGDFTPHIITVKAGTTVTWVNRDHMPHTVRSHQRGIFGSAKFYKGQRYSVQFLYPGTFDYHCSVHPGMVGTIRVVR
jgi:plastocyanin